MEGFKAGQGAELGGLEERQGGELEGLGQGGAVADFRDRQGGELEGFKDG